MLEDIDLSKKRSVTIYRERLRNREHINILTIKCYFLKGVTNRNIYKIESSRRIMEKEYELKYKKDELALHDAIYLETNKGSYRINPLRGSVIDIEKCNTLARDYISKTDSPLFVVSKNEKGKFKITDFEGKESDLVLGLDQAGGSYK